MMYEVDVTNWELVTFTLILDSYDMDNGSFVFKIFNCLFTLGGLDVALLIHFTLMEIFEDQQKHFFK